MMYSDKDQRFRLVILNLSKYPFYIVISSVFFLLITTQIWYHVAYRRIEHFVSAKFEDAKAK